MTPFRKAAQVGRHLLTVLGAPGLMIGVFSLASLGFGLFVLANEYDRPRRAARDAIRRIVAHWVRIPDYLGLTLVDHADLWRSAVPSDKALRLEMLQQSLDQLAGELERQADRFPLIHVVSLKLSSGQTQLAHWQTPVAPPITDAEFHDDVPLLDDEGPGSPAAMLHVRYRVAAAFEGEARRVETSFHRVLLGLVGLSGFSLLCLGYMILQAQALSRRVARESAQEATLDLADRACHELGNGVFVLVNERRNLSGHLDLIERYIAEEPQARHAAASRTGLDPSQTARFDHALKKELAERGLEPEVELLGSASIARHVCRQIDVCSEYIRLTVKELDGFLKKTDMPVMAERVSVPEGIDEAVTLLRPRFEATEVRLVRDSQSEAGLIVVADRRLFVHVLVNLLKNAVEAVVSPGGSGTQEVGVHARRDGSQVWISVVDNGPGIPPHIQKRIFDDGFTTKGAGRGRGLAIVRESVYVQNGELECHSRPGQTEFRVGLPAADGDVSATPGR